jgi:hypothetical protein
MTFDDVLAAFLIDERTWGLEGQVLSRRRCPAGIMAEITRAEGGTIMQVAVLLEPVAGNGYRAIGTEGLTVGLSAEGATREEALDQLRKQVEARIAHGAEIRPLDVPVGPHPWSRFAGTLRDEPLLDAWKQAMEDYRRRLDEDPDAL